MLAAIGLTSIDQLFAAIPPSVRLDRALNLPPAVSEWELEKHLRELADKNANVHTHLSFLGGGMYQHHIPAVVDAIVDRGEFLTAYTPYQPEMSQGLLQGLAEYQESIAAITGLPLVNCSGYDGATAFADSAWMACLITGKRVIAMAESVWPQWKKVVHTAMSARGVAVVQIASDPATGLVDRAEMESCLTRNDIAGFLFQSPNAFGCLESTSEIAAACKGNQVISSLSFHPFLSGMFKTPGEVGIDIATCEGQSLGIPMSAGGAGLGVFATRKQYRAHLPGRLVGKVADIHGVPAYALVYEDREQHVARERATSNICSNQALHSLRAAVYLSLLGEDGFSKVAGLNAAKAHYLADQLCRIDGVRLARSAPFFNEFLLELPCSARLLIQRLASQGIFPGLDLSADFPALTNCLLVAVTEVKTRAELDRMAQVMRSELRLPSMENSGDKR